ncbi:MAG: hypothetical protein ABSG94_09205 [Brevinematales bacterium]|jgi:hypothetical protein
MGNSGISGLKIAVIFILFTGFLFVLIEQRLESKEYDQRVRYIQKEVETLNAQKMELSMGIDSELQRLSSYDYSSMGQPITMRDVIIVPVTGEPVRDRESCMNTPQANFFDKIISRLINSF